jgi:hypothetical protein
MAGRKRGDVRTAADGSTWKSHGTAGRDLDGNDAGDLEPEGWKKAVNDSYNRDGGYGRDTQTTDEPNPLDKKGWRREYWERQRPENFLGFAQGGKVLNKKFCSSP